MATPNPDGLDLDRLSVKLSTVGVKDVTFAKGPESQTSQAGIHKYIQNLMRTDREQYERLVELMRLFNKLDIDLRLVSQLKTCFVSKEQGALS